MNVTSSNGKIRAVVILKIPQAGFARKPNWDYRDKWTTGGIVPNFKIGILKIPRAGFAQKPDWDYQDKWSTGGIFPNLLKKIGIQKIPWAGFAQNTHPRF